VARGPAGVFPRRSALIAGDAMSPVLSLLNGRADLSHWRLARRREGARIALVPTLGNLHAGHLALVAEAKRRSDAVLVSIFVNPTQFAPGEDYASYPRTLQHDTSLLAQAGVEAVFAPSPEVIYPNGLRNAVMVDVPPLAHILCGASRPGHFRGVAGVITRLFNLVAPDLAVFGEKDYQQLQLIRRLVEELFFPVEIVAVPTVREASGLALSSRNQYLTPDERERAPLLYRSLEGGADKLLAGTPVEQVESAGWAQLRAGGLRPEYFSVRRDDDELGPPSTSAPLRIFAAAWLGHARLIDNIPVPR